MDAGAINPGPGAAVLSLVQDILLMDAQLRLARSNAHAAVETERRDAKKAFDALCAAKYPTPLDGYGNNSSWAISDLCRALAKAEDRIQQLTLDIFVIEGNQLSLTRLNATMRQERDEALEK